MGPVVWAVDPYENDVIADLRILYHCAETTEICPVYVASTSPEEIEKEFT